MQEAVSHHVGAAACKLQVNPSVATVIRPWVIPAEAGVGLVGSLSRDLFYASLSLGSFGLMMTLDLADLLEIQNGTLIQIL